MYRHPIPRRGAMTLTAFARLRDDAMADFTQRADPPRNTRQVRCRVCLTHIALGTGWGYDEYMTDGYRFARRYVCDRCYADTLLRDLGEL